MKIIIIIIILYRNEHPFTEEEKNELLGDFEDCDGPVHDPSRPILFHEFLELIIRIAIKKYFKYLFIY